MKGTNISEKIRALRAKSGLSLSELAARVGTSAATLSRYENGWERFELYTLEKIAMVLGCKLQLDFAPLAATKRTADLATCFKKIQRLFWDHKLEKSDFKKFPRWIVERVIEYGNMEDICSLIAVMGKRVFLKQVSGCRFQSQKTFNFWKSILEKEGIECTKKSFQRDVGNF